MVIDLSKATVDIALATDRIDPVRAFWEHQAGAAYQQTLPTGPGQEQLRFIINDSVLKLNRQDAPLPDAAPSGYAGLILPRDGLIAPIDLADPDGNRLTLVPPGHEGVTQAGIRLTVRDLDAHRRFYGEALDLPEEAPGRFRIGETLVMMEQSPDAPSDAAVMGPGWRYITLQVMRCLPAHERALAHGAREARAPAVMAAHARYSMIRDPDGNWIELSQRADLAGSIEP